MKKLLKTLFVIASISIVSVANASDPLIDSVVKVFKSDMSTIKYDITTVYNSSSQSTKLSGNQATTYLLKNGNSELTVTEFSNNGKIYSTVCDLHLDGFSYRFSTQGNISVLDTEQWQKINSLAFKVSDEEILADTQAELEMMQKKDKLSDELVKINSRFTGSTYNSILAGLKYYFLPLMPEENKIIVDGKETFLNGCAEYSKSGTQVIAGKSLQFIEYKTPDIFPIAMTARYYFDNGRLVKYVSITKNDEMEVSPELQAAYGDNIVTNMGGYTIINIHELTTDVDNNFLMVPPNIKIVKNPFYKRGMKNVF